MERSLGKRFQDEQIRRLINTVENQEQLRSIALKLLDLKITQEDTFLRMMFQWQGLAPAGEAAVVDPYDDPL